MVNHKKKRIIDSIVCKIMQVKKKIKAKLVTAGTIYADTYLNLPIPAHVESCKSFGGNRGAADQDNEVVTYVCGFQPTAIFMDAFETFDTLETSHGAYQSNAAPEWCTRFKTTPTITHYNSRLCSVQNIANNGWYTDSVTPTVNGFTMTWHKIANGSTVRHMIVAVK